MDRLILQILEVCKYLAFAFSIGFFLIIMYNKNHGRKRVAAVVEASAPQWITDYVLDPDPRTAGVEDHLVQKPLPEGWIDETGRMGVRICYCPNHERKEEHTGSRLYRR